MDIILVPGLWLDAASWDAVTPGLKAAGHTVHPLTMPGVGRPVEYSAAITMADWVDAVVQQIDTVDAPVTLVGHSGGGNVVWGAADARPDAVSRVIFVDTVPPAPGSAIAEFPMADGVIPFPGWEYFPEEDVHDLTPELRTRYASKTRSVPARVPTDPIMLAGSRHRVPVTLLMGALDQEAFDAQVDSWGAYGREYRAIQDCEVLRIDSAHWPQFSVPDRLTELILAAVR